MSLSSFFQKKISPSHKKYVILYRILLKNNNKITNIMKKYLGIILIVLGALMLTISYFVDLVDYNDYNAGAFLLIVIGLIAHIQITKRTK